MIVQKEPCANKWQKELCANKWHMWSQDENNKGITKTGNERHLYSPVKKIKLIAKEC